MTLQRREFVTILGGAAAWPLPARAQQRALPTIGLLSSRSPVVDTPIIALIRQGLNEAGLIEGQHVAPLDYRWADGQYDRLPGLADALVRQQVAVIVTLGAEPPGLSAKAATATIPIVFAIGEDPVKHGLVTNLSRPGGNITGVTTFIAEMEPKHLGLLRELRPHATTIAVLVNPGRPQAKVQVSDIQAAARSVGQQINILDARTIRDIDAAFATLAQMRANALLVTTDPFFFTRATQLVGLAARNAIPTLYARREFAADGGLMSYGPNANDSYRLLGLYAARILKGEKPADLPVQRATRFELVINLSTANALGLQVPPTLLALADEVIP